MCLHLVLGGVLNQGQQKTKYWNWLNTFLVFPQNLNSKQNDDAATDKHRKSLFEIKCFGETRNVFI